ncbi:phospholipid scramblase 4-like [Mustela nigripes]|uniref:phospholipid scramblase 4-like n=1 Tax=Mustela nigripes TaxID=77151 RepID=UPI0028153C71|nr:phospholipid scramblase 4-like [Mustela nigripes]XP_059244078.1 phospholipid scramblase 4-like [Mustela nigripes]XP_059244079.1 phospholipid scramblase 4-like [Mustela nigripes]
MTSFETNNRYDIKNSLDQMVYIVTEDTDDFTRNAYRTLRPFVLQVTDCMGREIMTMQRPFRCTCCCLCCPSARQELEVPCPLGVTIGFVAQHWNLSRAVYSIQNEKKENVMRVRRPCSTYGCGSDSVFEDFYMITAYLRQEDFSWGTWVAQSVEQLTLTFNSGHDLKVLVSSPTGSTLSRESAEDSSSLSVCPPPLQINK